MKTMKNKCKPDAFLGRTPPALNSCISLQKFNRSLSCWSFLWNFLHIIHMENWRINSSTSENAVLQNLSFRASWRQWAIHQPNVSHSQSFCKIVFTPSFLLQLAGFSISISVLGHSVQCLLSPPSKKKHHSLFLPKPKILNLKSENYPHIPF